MSLIRLVESLISCRPAIEAQRYAAIGGGVPELSNDDVRAIEAVHNRWLEVERAGNSSAVLQLCTDDVMWIPPTSPALVGKEAIGQWLRGSEVEIKSLGITDLHINGSGAVAYKTGNYSTAYVAERSPRENRIKGTHLWVLHKLPDDSWKVAIVTWNMPEAS